MRGGAPRTPDAISALPSRKCFEKRSGVGETRPTSTGAADPGPGTYGPILSSPGPNPWPLTPIPSPDSQYFRQSSGHDLFFAFLQRLWVDVDAGAAGRDGDRRLAVAQRFDHVIDSEAERGLVES